jgi:hypothetical protein
VPDHRGFEAALPVQVPERDHLPAALHPLFAIPLWKRLLASVLYGGITEELFMRLFLVSAPLAGRGVIHPSTLNRRYGRGLFTANHRSDLRRLVYKPLRNRMSRLSANPFVSVGSTLQRIGPRGPSIPPVCSQTLILTLGCWFLLAPESPRRVGVALHRPLGRTVDPPRALFIRLIGLTWLLLIAWSTWTQGR